MPDYEEQIKEIEEEIRTTKYNKATQHHIGLLKAKLARLREKQVQRSSGGKKGDGYSVKKSGDATVVLVGFPSVGKSTLLNKITDAASRVGSYAFTTLTVIPGVMEYHHAKIQVLDVPGIVHGAASGKGRGKEVLAVMRNADLIILLVDVQHPGHGKVLQKELYDAGMRLNQKPPDVRIKKNARGGMTIASTVKLKQVEKKTLQAVLMEFKFNNVDVVVREDITIDQFIDALEGNRQYVPALTVLNKMDMVSEKKLAEIKSAVKPDLCISAEKDTNVDQFKELIFQKLKLMRVYCKEVGKKADLDVPLIVSQGATVRDVCQKLHRDFLHKFRFARVWGTSAKFPGQRLTLRHVLHDSDIVEIHLH